MHKCKVVAGVKLFNTYINILILILDLNNIEIKCVLSLFYSDIILILFDIIFDII